MPLKRGGNGTCTQGLTARHDAPNAKTMPCWESLRQVLLQEELYTGAALVAMRRAAIQNGGGGGGVVEGPTTEVDVSSNPTRRDRRRRNLSTRVCQRSARAQRRLCRSRNCSRDEEAEARAHVFTYTLNNSSSHSTWAYNLHTHTLTHTNTQTSQDESTRLSDGGGVEAIYHDFLRAREKPGGCLLVPALCTTVLG